MSDHREHFRHSSMWEPNWPATLGAFGLSLLLVAGLAGCLADDMDPPGVVDGVEGDNGDDDNGDNGNGVGDIEPPTLSATPDFMNVTLEWDSEGPVDLIYASDFQCDWENYTTCPDSGIIADIEGDERTLYSMKDDLPPGEPRFFVTRNEGGTSAVVGATPWRPFLDGAEALTVTDERIYVGGNFDHAGAHSPGSAVLDGDTGELVTSRLRALDDDGDPALISDVIPDGEGGFFVAGRFVTINDQTRTYLARVDDEGGLEPDWNPTLDDSVRHLERKDDTLYIAGNFSSVEGNTREQLAAFDIESGELTDWTPQLELPATVNTLLASGDAIYVGGSLNMDGHPDKPNLVAVTPDDGDVLDDFEPAPDARVQDLLTDGNRLFAAGEWSEIDGTSQPYLAALHLETGEYYSDWEPDLDNEAWVLLRDDESLYVGGRFTNVNGDPRGQVARLNLDTADLDTGFEPEVEGASPTNQWISDMALSGGHLFLAGNFNYIDDEPRYNLGAIDVSDGSLADIAIRGTDGSGAMRIAMTYDDRVQVGGAFDSIHLERRESLAAFDSETLTLDSWAPEIPEGNIQSLETGDGQLFVGGFNIEEIEGESRSNLAAFDLETGELTDWGQDADDGVLSLVHHNGTVTAGGLFDDINGETDYRNLAQFDSTGDGALTGFVPAPDGIVRAVGYHDGHVYAAGPFDEIDSQNQPTLARLDAGDGSLDTDWEPEIDMDTGGMGPDSPDPRDLAFADGHLHLVGIFNEANDEEAWAVAGFALDDADLLEWDESPNFAPHRVVAGDDRLFVLGPFEEIGDESIHGLAAFHRPDAEFDANWSVADDLWEGDPEQDLVFDSGTLYALDEAFLHVLDPATGEAAWD